MRARVFLQSGDAAVHRALAEQLTAQGFVLEMTAAGADLILLELPASAHDLRAGGHHQPILMLGADPDQARALGADDGLSKPFRFGDLLRRLRQLGLRDAISVGRFRLDTNAREMTDGDGQTVRLTEKEAAILAYLARANGRTVGRDRLLDEVWGYASSATTHTVETHIYRLRRKLSDHGGADLLVTDNGGYRLGSG